MVPSSNTGRRDHCCSYEKCRDPAGATALDAYQTLTIQVCFGVIGQNVCPFWLVFLCGSGRFSCSSCMGGELEVGQNVCPEWPVRPCGTTVE